MKHATILAGACVGALVLGACSGGADRGDDAGEAQLTISLTDAPSDELESFVVDVTAIQLTRLGGAVVGALPEAARVDLTTLAEVSQVLTALNLPSGLYHRATVTLDFTEASAHLVGQSAPAQIVDGDGVPLTGNVSLPIAVGNLLNLPVGSRRVLELDFELDQSVSVDAAANSVAVEPVIVLRVDRDDPKERALTGVIEAVDVTGGTIEVEVQTLNGARLHDAEVQVDEATLYQVDGVPDGGASGLAALAALPTGTWVQLYGSLAPGTLRFSAAYVEAGVGTYNGGTDIVEGHVVGRLGGAGVDPVLTVLGRGENAAHTSFQFNTTFTVHLDRDQTRVVRRGSGSGFDTDDLNVGQRVRIFGDLGGQVMQAAIPGSVARLRPTHVFGFAARAPSSGQLELDVSRVGVRTQDVFAWGEGGPTPADPDHFMAQVGSLPNGLSLGAGSAVELVGFFPAVDDAAEDFVASSLVDRDAAPSLVSVRDLPWGFQVTPIVSTDSITLDVVGSPGLFEHAVVDRGFVGVEPLPSAPPPSLVPAGPFGLYFLRDRTTGTVRLDLGFADFAAALEADLALGARLRRLGALGEYSVGANSLEAGLIVVTVD